MAHDPACVRIEPPVVELKEPEPKAPEPEPVVEEVEEDESSTGLILAIVITLIIVIIVILVPVILFIKRRNKIRGDMAMVSVSKNPVEDDYLPDEMNLPPPQEGSL